MNRHGVPGICRENARFYVPPPLADLLGHRLRAPLLCTSSPGYCQVPGKACSKSVTFEHTVSE